MSKTQKLYLKQNILLKELKKFFFNLDREDISQLERNNRITNQLRKIKDLTDDLTYLKEGFKEEKHQKTTIN